MPSKPASGKRSWISRQTTVGAGCRWCQDLAIASLRFVVRAFSVNETRACTAPAVPRRLCRTAPGRCGCGRPGRSVRGVDRDGYAGTVIGVQGDGADEVVVDGVRQDEDEARLAPGADRVVREVEVNLVAVVRAAGDHGSDHAQAVESPVRIRVRTGEPGPGDPADGGCRSRVDVPDAELERVGLPVVGKHDAVLQVGPEDYGAAVSDRKGDELILDDQAGQLRAQSHGR